VTPGSGSPSPGGSADGKTDLATTRTILAAERTLMAWVRTALSMISFGFTIYKFLKGGYDAGAIHLRNPDGPRNIGLFLVALGTGSLLAGIVEHVTTLRRLPGPRSRVGAPFYLACAVSLLGLVVLVGLIRHEGPF
jgi:putative membrane protein